MNDSRVIGDLFFDSGAFSLYNQHVRKRGSRVIGSNGKPLFRKHRRGQGDYSFFSLKKGSEFRAYLDRYASFMRRMLGLGIEFANVDVIGNPELTFDVQSYFEIEHGLYPIPVVHFGESLEYVERYWSMGHLRLGLGGLGQYVKTSQYIKWADQVFRRICPASDGYKPQLKIHGFAIASWHLITRYPWFSVDSSTWAKMTGFGWLLVPRWGEDEFVYWDYNKPPILMNVAKRDEKEKAWKSGLRKPSQMKDRHIDTAKTFLREQTLIWLESNHVLLREAATDFHYRSLLNARYYQNLADSRPSWPHPLNVEGLSKSIPKLSEIEA